MYLAIPFVGAFCTLRLSPSSSSRPPFILRDNDQHGSEYTLGAGRWQAYFAPDSTIRRSNRAWQRQRSGGNG